MMAGHWVEVHQLRSDRSNGSAYLNVNTQPGGIGVWGHDSDECPLYLFRLKGMTTAFEFVQFESEADATEWFTANAKYIDAVMRARAIVFPETAS